MALPSERPNTLYASSRSWADQYTPAVKRVLGEYFIEEAPQYDDRNQATDLRFPAERPSMSVRVRKFADAARYDGQFTIRSNRSSGTTTELEKILQGYAEVYCYGFAAEEGTELCAWFLGDMRVFRHWYFGQLEQYPDRLPGQRIDNGDGTALTIFRLRDLPPEFVLARKRFACVQ